MNHVTLRPFTSDDVDFALAQTAREGWDATAELFQVHLSHDRDGCFVAKVETSRVGLVTTTRYARTGWISNLIVAPEHRRRGIGESLMTHAMNHLLAAGVKTIRLEADQQGVKLYRRLGFADEFETPRFVRAPQAVTARGATHAITPTDLPIIKAFDARHFGDHRGHLIELLYERARATYWLPEGEWTRGFALTWPSRCGTRIGPWYATDDWSAETLLKAILADAGDDTIILALPAASRSAIALLRSHGFEHSTVCLRMVYGPAEAAGQPDRTFAIANGAMG